MFDVVQSNTGLCCRHHDKCQRSSPARLLGKWPIHRLNCLRQLRYLVISFVFLRVDIIVYFGNVSMPNFLYLRIWCSIILSWETILTGSFSFAVWKMHWNSLSVCIYTINILYNKYSITIYTFAFGVFHKIKYINIVRVVFQA